MQLQQPIQLRDIKLKWMQLDFDLDSCLLDNVLGPNIKIMLPMYPLDMENKAINDKYAISDLK